MPAGFRSDGLPFGVTLAAPAHQDHALLHLASRIQQAYPLPLGATGVRDTAPQATRMFIDLMQSDYTRLAVCGAHLSGLPLNAELTKRQGRLLKCTRTAPDYRLYALGEEASNRPGMVRVGENEQGYAIEVEVWELPVCELGSFVAGIPKPLGIGMVTLVSGEHVQGFLCEYYAVAHATDISQFGGWRTYLKQLNG